MAGTSHVKKGGVDGVGNITHRKPLLVFMDLPSGVWDRFNGNVDFDKYPNYSKALQDKTKPLLELMAWTADTQPRESDDSDTTILRVASVEGSGFPKYV